MPLILVIEWLESDEGWQRPDGYSLHLSEEDAKNYIKEYWARMPKDVPCEYSRPVDPRGFLCECSESLYAELLETKEKHSNISDRPLSLLQRWGLRRWGNDGKIQESATGTITFVDKDEEQRKKKLENEELADSVPSPS